MMPGDLTTASSASAGGTGTWKIPGFDGLAERIGLQTQALDHLSQSVRDPLAATALRTLAERTAHHAPQVCLVGQVKAGKTLLSNALAGAPGLLPVDVNPWTSAITSLHLNQPWRSPKVLFRFFDRDDWSKLVEEGGRLGALARRADLDGEAETLKAQVEALRRAAIARLGDRFESLLGRSHGFDAASRELIERYVCAGDPDAGTAPGGAGRYSEITKTADLALEMPAYAIPLTICDTPGVNDTFLVREQLTLQHLEHADICVLVLSAHQALSSADVGLLRLLTGLRPQQIVLFVNRIDELTEPEQQVVEIRGRMRETLAHYQVVQSADIVFGSAACANAAMSARAEDRADAALIKLRDWRLPDRSYDAVSPEDAWEASGLPELLKVIGAQLETGPALRAIEAAASEGLDILRRYEAMVASESAALIDTVSLAARIDPLIINFQTQAQAIFSDACARFESGIQQMGAEFAAGECDRLAEALQSRARKTVLSVDAAALRRGLSDRYKDTCEGVRAQMATLFQETIDELEETYRTAIGAVPEISPPVLPAAPSPVSIGGAMAIDAEMPWWRSWFDRRRAVEAKVQALREMIVAEARSVGQELVTRQIALFAEATMQASASFLEGHVATLFDLVRPDDWNARAQTLEQAGLHGSAADRQVQAGREVLETLVALEDEDRSAAA